MSSGLPGAGARCAGTQKPDVAAWLIHRKRHRLHRIAITMAPTTDVEAIRNSSLSILQLITTNPRERLYVHPLLWTSRHLALLGWEFVDDGVIDVASLPQPDPPKEELLDDDGGLSEARSFVNSPESIGKRISLSWLLKGLGIEYEQ